MDESPKQLIGEVKAYIPASPGRPERYDYEYKRCGVCNIFMAYEPLAGKRLVRVTERKTMKDRAHFLMGIASQYENAEKITLVVDNYTTHSPGSLYEAFVLSQAKALWDRFEFAYTPKHGSWLNIAGVELNVLAGQCLNRRMTILVMLEMKYRHGRNIEITRIQK
jgi:hypothetical protein